MMVKSKISSFTSAMDHEVELIERYLHYKYNSHYINSSHLRNRCQPSIHGFHGKIIPPKELPSCPDVGRYRRALDDLAAKGLVSAGTKEIPRFSGISGRGCSEYVIRPPERHGRARPNRT